MKTKYMHLIAEYPQHLADCLVEAETYAEENDPFDYFPGFPRSVISRVVWIDSEFPLPDVIGPAEV